VVCSWHVVYDAKNFKIVQDLNQFIFHLFEKFTFIENTKWKVRQLPFHVVVMLGKIIIQGKIQLQLYHSTKPTQKIK
jgi:hypothetical protein